jgi:hypothetical protein
VFNAFAVTAIINALVNAGIAWLSVKAHHSVPLWRSPGLGRTSTIVDTVGTFFFLPLFTCVLVTTAVWREVRSGRLPPLAPGAAGRSLIERLPGGRWKRGLVLGGLSTALLTSVAVPLLVGLDVGDLSKGTFVVYKAALGVGLGLIVTPVVAIRAMLDRH